MSPAPMMTQRARTATALRVRTCHPPSVDRSFRSVPGAVIPRVISVSPTSRRAFAYSRGPGRFEIRAVEHERQSALLEFGDAPERVTHVSDYPAGIRRGSSGRGAVLEYRRRVRTQVR